jgi:hypothetical protein
MKRVAIVLVTVTALGLGSLAAAPVEARVRGGVAPAVAGGLVAGAVVGGVASSTYAYGSGYGYWGGYTLGYYRDYTPVGTYDGYIPVTHTQYTTYNDGPVYLGYRYRTVVHPANDGGHHRRHW